MLKKLFIRGGIPAAIGGITMSAHAALPTAVDTAFTDFQANATALLDKGWPLLIAVFGGMVLMKLFKKVGNKAT